MKKIILLLTTISTLCLGDQGWLSGGIFSMTQADIAQLLSMGQISTPVNPPAGFNALYFKSDNNLYKLDSSGNEVQVGGTTGANQYLSNLLSPTAINQSLLFDPDNTYDIGADGASRPAAIHAANHVTSPLVKGRDNVLGAGQHDITVRGGNGTTGNKDGGNLTLASGTPSGTGITGHVYIKSGSTTALDINDTGTINVPVLTASQLVATDSSKNLVSLARGNLSEATSSVLTITGGTSSVLGSGTSIEVKQASSSQSGYLSSSDWTTFNNKQAAGNYATTDLSNLASPTAISQDLTFNKATAANITGSDSKATQANHNLTIRAGNTGSAVAGGSLILKAGSSDSGYGGGVLIQGGNSTSLGAGNVTIRAGSSTTNNGGSIYFRLDEGNSNATRGIYFYDRDGLTPLVVDSNVNINKQLIFTTDNTYTIGASTTGPSNIANRPSYVFVGTGFYGPFGSNGFISGGERIYDNAAASGSLTVRGGDAADGTSVRATSVAGNLTLRGGDHPGATGGSTTPAAGSLTIRGGNRTAGTGNAGNVTISGGTSVGGTNGYVLIRSNNSDVLKATTSGTIQQLTSISIKSIHAQTGTSDVITVSSTDHYVGVDSSGAAKTVNLPSAATVGAGRVLIITDEGGSATSKNITVDPNGSETINGDSTFVMKVNYDSITIISNGTNWFII